MPAYFFDPYMYKAHRMKGGTFQNFSSKTYLPLTDEEAAKHIEGQQLIGIYPLLPDNTSWFIAADFDETKWVDHCRTALEEIKSNGIPAYLERSRSGNGGHIWIFFEKPYPAAKSRKLLLHILERAGVISAFDKSSSFDRLFPNQDYLTGKGLGNLIALPFHGPSMENGNSCFVDPDTLIPFPDQSEFLGHIQKVHSSLLDRLYTELCGTPNVTASESGTLRVELSGRIRMPRASMPLKLVNFLRDELNFPNPDFYMKKNAGKSTWQTKRYFSFIEERDNEVIVPRGIAGKLLRFCKENNIEYSLVDQRVKGFPVIFKFNAQLRDYQLKAVEAAGKKDIGIIVAPPGSGKTVTGLKIVAVKQQPALVIVHRKQLVDQWVERIQAFLDIPAHQIGRIEGGRSKIGEKITIATIQSLVKCLQKENQLHSAVGTILVDECHHVPAESFKNALAVLNSHCLYGLTATPFRKHDEGKMIFAQLGEIICEIKPEDIAERKHARIIIRNTELNVPFNSKTDRFETISKILVHDSARNSLILQDVNSELSKGKKTVIITERKEHIDVLNQYLKTKFETVTLCGDDKDAERNTKWKQIKSGSYQVIITTGQYFGEGTDLNDVHCLFLVYPFSFEGKLVQYIGRVQRSELTPLIYDFRDHRIEYLNKLFLKRNAYYRKIQKLPDLFDEPFAEYENKPRSLTVEKDITIQIDQLEFRYGSVAFKCPIPDFKQDIEFEIENMEIRPEFDVLKPYFQKHLRSKQIAVHIFAEYEDGEIVSLLANSPDLQKLNREVVEGVRFRFIQSLGSAKLPKSGLIDAKEFGSSTQGVYESAEEMLAQALSNTSYKHLLQLRYLAEKHEGSVMKLRFVLTPFSFVFLLKGEGNYHVVLETLDTEEATYIWHFGPEKSELPGNLRQVDENLNMIRNAGRQAFMQSPPVNFCRVVHDYSEERKGFVVWRDALEEMLD
jgi:superfamily II DNA or RNA helicase